MQRLSLSACSRCRTSIFRSSNPDQWLYTTGLVSIFRRHRSEGNSSKRHPRKWDSSQWKPPVQRDGRKFHPQVDPDNIPAWVEADVVRWAKVRELPRRLESFGISSQDIQPLLNAFVHEVRRGRLSSPKAAEKYGLIRFSQKSSEAHRISDLDIIHTSIFFTWASNSLRQDTLGKIVSPSTITTIQRLAKAADRYYPEEEFLAARSLNRKVIMHVGPTNSGKTHHALRALAAAPVGIYAGPLRLLAHEIWERLNLGQIVPLGVEEEAGAPPARSLPNAESALDVHENPPVVQKVGNPKYARVCNMITGEEQRVVDPHAPLVSCTVEMVTTHRMMDVAVIDEIQMIADEQRGGGWTHAVLGICAKELHLCGEETAVPVIQALLKDTGDELIIKRYERLSPLVVEKESLDGDFSLVRKGDCIVTFRRTSIFAMKRQVEEQTGMRCAVVYGRLPPELRSEQAALFNDPNSGYDVLIGSDAIGMGLNLKIRRVIFEAVRKWDGGLERPLSISQIKQIAGRAGRYGLHGDEAPGGFVTTLRAADLPFLTSTMKLPNEPLQFARLSPCRESFANIADALPPGSSTETMYKAHMYVSRMQPTYRYVNHGERTLAAMCDFIDKYGQGLTMSDRVQLFSAPVPWRDEDCMKIVVKFIQMYRDELNVNLMQCLKDSDYLEVLARIEEKIAAGLPPRSRGSTLEKLESLHKVLVMYLWMGFRNPVSYNCRNEVTDLKTRVEKALDWTLEGMSKVDTLDRSGTPWEVTRAERHEGKRVTYNSRLEPRKQVLKSQPSFI